MITILSRIFSLDISQYIYKILLNDYFVSKIYLLELLLEKIIKKYNCYNFYNALSDITDFKLIEKLLFDTNKYVISKNYYYFDDITKELIIKYINTIKNVNFVDNSYIKFTTIHLNNINRFLYSN